MGPKKKIDKIFIKKKAGFGGRKLVYRLCVCRGGEVDGTMGEAHWGIQTQGSLSHMYVFVFLDICLYRDSVRRIPNRPVRPV